MDKLIFNAANMLSQQAVSRHMFLNELANLSTTGFKTSYKAALQSVKADGQGFDTRFQSQIVQKDFINLQTGSREGFSRHQAGRAAANDDHIQCRNRLPSPLHRRGQGRWGGGFGRGRRHEKSERNIQR